MRWKRTTQDEKFSSVADRFPFQERLSEEPKRVVLQKLAEEHNGQGFPVLVGLRPPLQTGWR